MAERTCPCGLPLPGDRRSYCSEPCSIRWKGRTRQMVDYGIPVVNDRTCVRCGDPFTVPDDRGPGRFPKQCPNCLPLGKMPDHYDPVPDTPRPCLRCGESFMGRGSAGYCSTLCRNRVIRERRKARDPERYKLKRREYADRHRARKFGATVEVFTHQDVFDRDGWICGLCGDPIPQDAKHPDPLSVSLDHVVPLSLGGEHSMANTQASHFLCNVTKGANVDVTAGRSR